MNTPPTSSLTTDSRPKRKGPIGCISCGAGPFYSEEKRTEHVRDTHLTCRPCGFVATGDYEFRNHMTSAEHTQGLYQASRQPPAEPEPPSPPPAKPKAVEFGCGSCSVPPFGTAQALRRHREKSHPVSAAIKEMKAGSHPRPKTVEGVADIAARVTGPNGLVAHHDLDPQAASEPPRVDLVPMCGDEWQGHFCELPPRHEGAHRDKAGELTSWTWPLRDWQIPARSAESEPEPGEEAPPIDQPSPWHDAQVQYVSVLIERLIQLGTDPDLGLMDRIERILWGRTFSVPIDGK